MVHQGEGLSTLSCYTCKRRKVRCNRTLPTCSLCLKHGGTCEYPTISKRAGPKIGNARKKGLERRKVSVANAPSRHGLSPSVDPSASHITGLTTRGAHESGWPPQHDDATRPCVTHRSRSIEASREGVSSAPTFSQIMELSKGEQTGSQTPSSHGDHPELPIRGPEITKDGVCGGLQISRELYMCLMKSYFDNMTSFTLFKPNSIEAKFFHMRSQVEAEALVAAMFTFAARFLSDYQDPNRVSTCPTPSYFADIASKQLRKALDSYEDTARPFHLLQAAVLDAFYHITTDVRFKSWNILGSAIRLAYDLKLHLVDVHSDRDSNSGNIATDAERWSMLEERRRAWWALWEMDVFASAVRRLPMAIDGMQNFTYLPVPDKCWFECVPQASCFLPHDPGQRWRYLSKTGNTSPKAWFIVINSLVQDARLLVYNPSPTTDSANSSKEENLTVIANALYCAATSIPTDLVYEGQYLDFQTRGSPHDINCRQYHSDIYSIHIMTQLVHFMIDHHLVWSQANKSHSNDDSTTSSDLSSWANYMKVPENMVAIIRNSSHEHFKYVNPCLTYALWFAAAAQTACQIIGPPSRAKMLASSSYDLLELTIERGLSFWGIADVLKPRLAKIEAAFRSLTNKEGKTTTRYTKSLAPEDSNATSGSSSNTRVNQLTSQSQSDIPPVDHKLPWSETRAATMVADPRSYTGMFPGSNDPVALQLIFDELEHFLPYGMDESFWASQSFLPPNY